MSILNTQLQIEGGRVVNGEISAYQPKGLEQERLALVRRAFGMGDLTMRMPRREFNDMSVLARTMVDEMAFNTYQPNNGEPAEGDLINGWKSQAMRPVVRNKVISIAAHATARLTFPKIFAYSRNDEAQREAAKVMEDLMEWTADQSDYRKAQFYATVSSLVHPVAIIHTEYCETYNKVKRGKKEDGTYETEEMLVEDLSGFQDSIVPPDQLYIENFYENDVQKQGFLIWRRVISYELAYQKYAAKYPNMKFVHPGVQVIWNDANTSFYNVYDPNMRTEMVEEVIYYNRALDLKLIMVNGVLLTDPDNPNPRNDKRYPFVTFGYEPIGDGKCFYYKSLAFKMQQDANIVNTLYPMIIDGTYLNLMPPMVAVGAETIGSDVIVPGAVTTFTDPNADLRSIKLSENLQAGLNTLFKVEESLNASSQEPILSGQQMKGSQTAYEISKIESNAQTVLGLYLQLKAFSVVEYGKLRISDILQYMTIPEVQKIEGIDNAQLVYKTFLIKNKISNGREVTRKIRFDGELPDEMPYKDYEKMSFDLLEEQGGPDGEDELYKVNPRLFRDLKYMLTCTADTLAPLSEDVERAYKLEAYDRLIQNPMVDQEQVLRDFLLDAYPQSSKNVSKYIKKQDATDAQGMLSSMMKGGGLNAMQMETPTSAAPLAQMGM